MASAVETARCVIPAKCPSFAVRINAMPQTAGKLQIDSCDIVFLGITMQYPLGKGGCLSEGAPLEYNVIPSQPFLTLVWSSRPTTGIFLYEGESATVELKYENMSSEPIENISIRCTPSFSESGITAQAEDVLYCPDLPPISASHVQKYKELSVQISLNALLTCTGGCVRIEYGAGKDAGFNVEVTRVLEIPIQMTVAVGLRITDLLVLPFQPALAEAIAQSENGHDDAKRRLSRIANTLNTSSDNLQSEAVAGAEVRQGWCLLSFEVVALMEESVQLQISHAEVPSAPIKLHRGSSRRVAIPIRQIPIDEKTLAAACTFADAQISALIKLRRQAESLEFPDRPSFALVKAIVGALQCRWKCGRRAGRVAALHHIRLSPLAQTHLRLPGARISHATEHKEGRGLSIAFAIELLAGSGAEWVFEVLPVIETESGHYLHSIDKFVELLSPLKHKVKEGCTIDLGMRMKEECRLVVIYRLASQAETIWCNEPVAVHVDNKR